MNEIKEDVKYEKVTPKESDSDLMVFDVKLDAKALVTLAGHQNDLINPTNTAIKFAKINQETDTLDVRLITSRCNLK